MIGLNSKVNYHGRIATIAELAREGYITFRIAENFSANSRQVPHTAYFADIGDTLSGWQLNKKTYEKAIAEFNTPDPLDQGPWDAHDLAELNPDSFLAPYTFAEKQAALVAKFAGTGVEWLSDVDFDNWEVAYQWLIHSSMAYIYHFAPVIESEHWSGTFPQLETGS